MPRTKQVKQIVDIVKVAPVVMSRRDELVMRVVEKYIEKPGTSLHESVVPDLVSFCEKVAEAVGWD